MTFVADDRSQRAMKHREMTVLVFGRFFRNYSVGRYAPPWGLETPYSTGVPLAHQRLPSPSRRGACDVCPGFAAKGHRTVLCRCSNSPTRAYGPLAGSAPHGVLAEVPCVHWSRPKSRPYCAEVPSRQRSRRRNRSNCRPCSPIKLRNRSTSARTGMGYETLQVRTDHRWFGSWLANKDERVRAIGRS